MEAMIDGEDAEVEAMLSRAGDVLSQASQQASFIIAPTVKQSRVKQIEFVPLGVRKLLCVLIANEEMIASHVVELEEPMNREEALALARFLNTELVGLPFSELLGSLQRRLLAQTDSFYHLVKRSLAILEDAFSTEPAQRLIVEGVSYVVSQSEFRKDPRKAHELLLRLEAEEELLACLGQDVSVERVRVRIGRELRLHGLEHCSCVTGTFAIGQEIVGGIGVLGPKRMDYRRLHALVEGMARSVTNVLTRWAGA
jgi:heat-inducible transcriptional repressor